MFGMVCNNNFIAVCQVCDYLYNISSYICTEGGCITFPTKSWKKLTFLHLLFQWEKSVLMHSDKIHFKKGVVKKSLFCEFISYLLFNSPTHIYYLNSIYI